MKKNNKKAIIITILIVLGLGIFLGYKLLNKENESSTMTPLLYEVTKEGSNNKIYLFGSIHVGNSNEMIYPKYVMDAYNKSNYLACEFDLVAYKNNQQKLIEDAMNMLYQDGTTIKDHLNENTYNKLINFLKEKNAYINTYEQFKLYFFVSLISNLTIQQNKMSEEAGVDTHFLNLATEDKKTILEIESSDFQMNIFEEAPDELFDIMINDSIDNFDISYKSLQALFDAWKTGNTTDILKYGSDDLKIKETYTKEQEKYINDFNKKLIDDRNDSMTRKAIEYFNNNQDVFYMVGAFHMVGENGIVNQLQKQGFTIKKIN